MFCCNSVLRSFLLLPRNQDRGNNSQVMRQLLSRIDGPSLECSREGLRYVTCSVDDVISYRGR